MLLASPFVLLLTWLRLRTGGYGKALAWARSDGNTTPGPAGALEQARQTAYALAVSVKYGPWKPKCLLRSMALGWFLGRKGVPFELKIGVPAGQSVLGAGGTLDFNAHAWVEYDGVVLNDKPDIADEFMPFTRRSGFIRDQEEFNRRGDRG